MKELAIFIMVYLAMIAMAFWESYVEGRNAWDKKKYGWKIRISKNITYTGYHFFIFIVMFPLLLALPLVIYGWDVRLFGILLSAYTSGMVLEDLMWYVVNPEVKFKEIYTSFSDYMPWITFKQKKILPWGYLLGILIAVIAWILFWN